MRNIKIVGMALLAVFAFSAFAATSSFASGKILLKGAPITSAIPFTMTETLELEDMNATGPPTILCSGSFDGTIAAGGATSSIAEVLTLAGEALEVGTGKKEYLVECEDMKSICSNPADVVAGNMPWSVEIEKMAAGAEEYLLTILNITGKVPAYTLDCNSILGLISDTCTAPAVGEQAVMKNEVGGLLAEFSNNETTTPPGDCGVGGDGQGLVVGDGFIVSSSGALTVSE